MQLTLDRNREARGPEYTCRLIRLLPGDTLGEVFLLSSDYTIIRSSYKH